jgi:hypothetical protein
MPEGVSDAELKYFQTMIDPDGDGAITMPEMAAVLKECWETSQSVMLQDKPEIFASLTRFSLMLKRETVIKIKMICQRLFFTA